MWLHIDGSAVGDRDFLLLMNMDLHGHGFVVPEADGLRWVLIIDTAEWAEPNCNYWREAEADLIAGEYEVAPWAVVVLEQLHA